MEGQRTCERQGKVRQPVSGHCRHIVQQLDRGPGHGETVRVERHGQQRLTAAIHEMPARHIAGIESGLEQDPLGARWQVLSSDAELIGAGVDRVQNGLPARQDFREMVIDLRLALVRRGDGRGCAAVSRDALQALSDAGKNDRVVRQPRSVQEQGGIADDDGQGGAGDADAFQLAACRERDRLPIRREKRPVGAFRAGHDGRVELIEPADVEAPLRDAAGTRGVREPPPVGRNRRRPDHGGTCRRVNGKPHRWCRRRSRRSGHPDRHAGRRDKRVGPQQNHERLIS